MEWGPCSLTQIAQVCHAGLEPRTSIDPTQLCHTALLLTRVSLDLDSCLSAREAVSRLCRLYTTPWNCARATPLTMLAYHATGTRRRLGTLTLTLTLTRCGAARPLQHHQLPQRMYLTIIRTWDPPSCRSADPVFASCFVRRSPPQHAGLFRVWRRILPRRTPYLYALR